MATLLLTAVGTLVGGPLGGALGALAGRSIDGGAIPPPLLAVWSDTNHLSKCDSRGKPFPDTFVSCVGMALDCAPKARIKTCTEPKSSCRRSLLGATDTNELIF